MRRWRKGLLDSGVSAVTTAKAYRLLKAVMNTAVDDGLIRRNPCRIKGAGQERSPERPILTIPQVYAFAEAIDQRYRALVLLGTFGSLRWGGLAALRRGDIDLTACTVSVDRQLTETIAGKPGFGPPKSEASIRGVAFPDVIAADLRWHLACFVQDQADALVITSPAGMPLRHSNFYRRAWTKAVQAVGLSDLHFHDLRHTGNTQFGSGREPARADGAHGPHQHSGGTHLPALDQRTAAYARRCGRQAGPDPDAPGQEVGRRRRIWHESGTAADAGLVNARITQTNMASELEFPVSAPGRTRTCDPLLRRQLLYPTELRAPGTTLCMPKVTCRPQAGWLSVAAAGPANLCQKGYPGPPHRRTPGQARPGRYPACPANSSISRSRTRPKPAESSAVHAGQPNRSNYSPH